MIARTQLPQESLAEIAREYIKTQAPKTVSNVIIQTNAFDYTSTAVIRMKSGRVHRLPITLSMRDTGELRTDMERIIAAIKPRPGRPGVARPMQRRGPSRIKP